jgi:hypothetical protein
MRPEASLYIFHQYMSQYRRMKSKLQLENLPERLVIPGIFNKAEKIKEGGAR